MNSFATELIKEALDKSKYDVISECVSILHPDSCKVVVEGYNGSTMRVFKHDKDVHVLCPKDVSILESEYLANAITTGEIFDDADMVERSADYVMKTGMPYDTMIRQGIEPPTEKMRPVVGLAIGSVDNGCVDCDDTNLRNGYAIMKDLVSGGENGNDIRVIVHDHMGLADNDDVPSSISKDFFDLKHDLAKLNDMDDEDLLPDDDIIAIDDIGDKSDYTDEDDVVIEGFLSKKPKKLKPIEMREIVTYITVQKNAIRDNNDLAMLSGYTCSKLEICDFYISCIDTNDARYIVPHDRASLVRYQNDLNRLLTEILKIKPVDKEDRVLNVKVPDRWRY